MTAEMPQTQAPTVPGADLVVFCLPGADPAAYRATGMAGFTECRAYLRTHAEQALAEGRLCLLIWQSPRQALAAAIAAGLPPSQAIAEWQGTAEDILDLFRRNRRRMVLVDSDLLHAAGPAETGDAADLRDRLAQRLGLDALPVLPAQTTEAPVTDLVAGLAPLALAQIQDVLAELQASSLALPPCPLPLDVLDRAMQSLTDAGRQQAQERALLMEQIRQSDSALQSAAEARAEAEQLRRQLQQMQAAVDQLAAAEKTALADLARHQGDETRARTEIDLLKAQIRHMQAPMEETLVALQRAEAECDRLQKAQNVAEQALSRALAEARREAEARGQAERDLQDLRQQLEAREQQSRDLQQQLHDRDATLARETGALHHRIAELEGEQAHLRAEVARIMSSASIRVTEPMRALRRWLGR